MDSKKFKEGDRVTVISECQSYGRQGTVADDLMKNWTRYIKVILDDGSERTYREGSLKKNREHGG